MKKAVASVIIGSFFWFVLMVVHEEWQQYDQGFESVGPPPFDPFNLWSPVALIVGTWLSLRVLVRWADRQLAEPVAKTDRLSHFSGRSGSR
jgi:hypothetical protein